MNVGIFATIVIVLFLTSYMSCIGYVKGLKNNSKNQLKDWQTIIICILFGGPALLITYMYSEVRLADIEHNRRYLISGIVLTILQIGVIIGICLSGWITY